VNETLRFCKRAEINRSKSQHVLCLCSEQDSTHAAPEFSVISTQKLLCPRRENVSYAQIKIGQVKDITR
jgi:hypothetical protein